MTYGYGMDHFQLAVPYHSILPSFSYIYMFRYHQAYILLFRLLYYNFIVLYFIIVLKNIVLHKFVLDDAQSYKTANADLSVSRKPLD